jgi:hypothetical protein
MTNLNAFIDLNYYSQHFTDLALWSPYVRQVCQRHGFSPNKPIRMGLPGTFPTFIVADRWVIKIFGELFDGANCFTIEKTVNELVAPHASLPIPAVMASGTLFSRADGWNWPYLVFSFIPGTSFGETADRISYAAKKKLAQDLARFVRVLHNIPFTPTSSSTLSLRNPHSPIPIPQSAIPGCLSPSSCKNAASTASLTTASGAPFPIT